MNPSIDQAVKTMRFAELVRTAGRPEHHLTWLRADRDPTLQKARAEHRVLSVHQHPRGNQKDFGVVGLDVGRDVQYYLFPRSLRRFSGARIIAINYGVAGEKVSLEPPKIKPLPKAKAPARPAPPARGEAAPAPPAGRSPAPRGKIPPPPPMRVDPTPAEIRRGIQAALHLLQARKNAAAKRKLDELLAVIPG